ncbi:hypothetical protein [Streptomyces sp. NPDC002758]
MNDRTPGKLTDAELNKALWLLCRRRDSAVRADIAHAYNEAACVLSAERDSRRDLALAVNDAVNPFRVVGTA